MSWVVFYPIMECDNYKTQTQEITKHGSGLSVNDLLVQQGCISLLWTNSIWIMNKLLIAFTDRKKIKETHKYIQKWPPGLFLGKWDLYRERGGVMQTKNLTQIAWLWLWCWVSNVVRITARHKSHPCLTRLAPPSLSKKLCFKFYHWLCKNLARPSPWKYLRQQGTQWPISMQTESKIKDNNNITAQSLGSVSGI